MKYYFLSSLLFFSILTVSSCSDKINEHAKELAEIKCDAAKEEDQIEVWKNATHGHEKHMEHLEKKNDFMKMYNAKMGKLKDELSKEDYTQLQIKTEEIFKETCK